MRIRLLLALLIGIFATNAAFAEGGVGKAPTPTGSSQGGPPQVGEAGGGRVPSAQVLGRLSWFEFVDVPLAEAMEHLAGTHRFEFHVDRIGLHGIGVTEEASVTAKGDRVPLEEALAAVLEPLGLTWLVYQDVLYITTPDDAECILETQVYQLTRPVRDLDGLVAQITTTVEPESWEDVGGPGSIAVWKPGALVVWQSYRVHRVLQRQFKDRLQPIVSEAPKARDRRRGGTAALGRLVGRRVTIEADCVPLAQVVESLAGQSRVKMALDEDALDDVGMAPDVPVRLRLRGVRLECALDLLGRSLGLGWMPANDNQGLLITTGEAASEELMLVTYDVRDLAVLLQGDVDSLVATITTTVMPGTWSKVGEPGEIKPASGGTELAVKQSFPVHRQLECLLSDLRQVGKR